MELLLDITQGIGLALAVGTRPFLPLLFVGALARADAGLNFRGTDYVFLQQPWFLLAVLLLLVVVVLAQRKRGVEAIENGPLGAAVAGLSLVAGALLFAASLAADGYLAWPGLLAGIACTLVAQQAVRGLMRRTRARLDHAAQQALPLYVDGAAVVIAALAVFAPPVSVIFLLAFGWLWRSGRRREDAKHAGLRILR